MVTKDFQTLSCVWSVDFMPYQLVDLLLIFVVSRIDVNFLNEIEFTISNWKLVYWLITLKQSDVVEHDYIYYLIHFDC